MLKMEKVAHVIYKGNNILQSFYLYVLNLIDCAVFKTGKHSIVNHKMFSTKTEHTS